MAEMIERMARALHDEWNGVGAWSSLTDRDRRRWEFMARAAIKEMREPSVSMVDCGVAFALQSSIHNGYNWSAYVTDKHRAMIDAALSPSPSR